MKQQQSKTIENATNSKGENMLEIHALTLRAEDLSQSVDWWNTAMIWALIFAALAAVAVVITTHMALRRAKELSDTQDQLIQAKDDQLKAELARLKAPRSLTHVPELIASLEPFEGTEYIFSFVFQDEDSTKLLQALDDVLQRAKWKRVKSQGRFPALEFWGKGGDAVTVGIGTGITISVESQESLAVLQARQVNDLPQYVRAAVALNLTLSSRLSPPQAPSDNKLVEVQKGDSKVVLIGVGKKP